MAGSREFERKARGVGDYLSPDELDALVGDDGYLHEPPDECEHGFSPPDECPNEGCPDKFVRSAWFKLRKLRAEKRDDE